MRENREESWSSEIASLVNGRGSEGQKFKLVDDYDALLNGLEGSRAVLFAKVESRNGGSEYQAEIQGRLTKRDDGTAYLECKDRKDQRLRDHIVDESNVRIGVPAEPEQRYD